MKTLEVGKIMVKTGYYSTVHEMDPIMIGYKGEGEDRIPPSLQREMINSGQLRLKLMKDFKRLLYEAVRHSQFVEFEEIK